MNGFAQHFCICESSTSFLQRRKNPMTCLFVCLRLTRWHWTVPTANGVGCHLHHVTSVGVCLQCKIWITDWSVLRPTGPAVTRSTRTRNRRLCPRNTIWNGAFSAQFPYWLLCGDGERDGDTQDSSPGGFPPVMEWAVSCLKLCVTDAHPFGGLPL